MAFQLPYSITDGGSVTSISVNQKIAPNTSIAGSGPTGGAWSRQQLVSGSITSYQVAQGGSLSVGISNGGADGYVIADAVMLVRQSSTSAASSGDSAGSATSATDAVLAALTEPQGGKAPSRTAWGGSNTWWLLYGE